MSAPRAGKCRDRGRRSRVSGKNEFHFGADHYLSSLGAVAGERRLRSASYAMRVTHTRPSASLASEALCAIMGRVTISAGPLNLPRDVGYAQLSASDRRETASASEACATCE